MEQYKLTYFNARGRGDVSRILFALADQDYVDERLTRDEFEKIKTTTPYGMLPVLEVDGLQIGQSNTIARFLANKFGFAGETTMDKVRTDMVVDCVEDLITDVLVIMRGEGTLEERKHKLSKFSKDKMTTEHLVKLENLLKQNKGGNGYFVGDNITWADVTVYHWCSSFSTMGVEVPLNGVPLLEAFISRMETNPRIAAFIDKRDQIERRK